MRVIVFFDLPVKTVQDRREYARFRKKLVKSGFVMMQQSVYSKIALNQNNAAGICAGVRKCKPPGRRGADLDRNGEAVRQNGTDGRLQRQQCGGHG